LKRRGSKKFLLRFGDKVSDSYIYSADEIIKNQWMKYLFDKFDFDNSGALDSNELTELYNRNEVYLQEKDIVNMYN
jgi:Ca2+-binding EF-hand superfamily protein